MNDAPSPSSVGVRASGKGDERWWERKRFLIAIALLSTLPLLWPDIPPLIDLPGHIGRYRVELDLHSSADLQRYYDFKWVLIGNLGVDLLVVPLAPVIGLEPAVKLIVICIPVLTVLGFFAVAREIHGRVPPTAFFAIPFVYSHPFNYGFVNFALSMGLALLAFALWLRLGRAGRMRSRAIIFIPVSCALWIVHAFGWGFLGVLAFSAELVRLREQQETWPETISRAVALMLPLSIPIVLVATDWGAEAATSTVSFFAFPSKFMALLYSLRDRWLWWDAIGLAAIVVLIGAAIYEKDFHFSVRLGIPAAALAIVFLLLPYRLFGSAHADMRIVPFALAIAVLAIRLEPPSHKLENRLLLLGLAFLALRLAGNTVSYSIEGQDWRDKLAALDRVPDGSAVLTLAGARCETDWQLPRHWHLGALVIARKNGFSNDQWQAAGAQLLSVRYEAAAPFLDVRSTLVFSPQCAAMLNRRGLNAPRVRTTQEALDAFPVDAFGYVWLIEPPDNSFKPPVALTEIFRGGDTILYRVRKPVST